MMGGTQNAAEACLARKVERLVHVGSIAGLYLGGREDRITGATPPDPKWRERSPYARAKAECDLMLMAMHRQRNLPVCVLRPGLVVGEGGQPFHTGLGLFTNERHCIGWNGGANPLPFVLVEDVADAVLRACTQPGVVGRCYNVVGDVRLSAREYLEGLAGSLGRPLRYHPGTAFGLWLSEMVKWSVKRAVGKAAEAPSLRDLRSRGLAAVFDCDDAKRDLAWSPVADPARFFERAILVHTAR